MLKATQSQTSVTALKFIDGDCVAAGCGSFLKIYNWRTSALIHTKRVLTLNKIHGIDTAHDELKSLIILWGGNELVVLNRITLDIEQSRKVGDRIVHAQCFQGTLYILTAHNEVLTFAYDSSETKQQKYLCEERSILYSGKLHITPTSQLVAAGTVFNGVVVWDLTTNQVVRRFEQHEGSIFDVAWNSDGSELASCSDDRAIIVSSMATGETIAKGWGHISRIWKLAFVDNSHLISAAEDCSVRLWELSKDSNELNCSKILTGHRGKSVWAVDVLNDIAVSGGGDGRVMLWDLDVADNVVKFNTQQEFGSVGVRSCVLLNSTRLSAGITTSSGQTFVYDDSKGWKTIGANLGSVATVKSYDQTFYSLAANGNGLAYNHESGTLKEFQLGYAVLDFFVIAPDLLLVVPIPPSRDLVVTSLDPNIADSIFKMPENASQPSCAVMNANHVSVGTRKGDLISYEVSTPEPQSFLLKALGTDTVTSVKVVNNTLVLATNRTSEYGIFSLDTLERLLMTRARKKGSIEGQCDHAQGRLLWGFQNDTFVAWNADLGFEFLAIQCGGAHRAWDFKVLGDKSAFAYARASELHIHTIASPSPKFKKPLLQHGTHGREIRGMETCPLNPLVLATASEDTTVNIYWIDPQHQFAESKVTVTDGHISGIQALHWHPDGKTLFTSAGQGELVMWDVVTRGSQIFVNEASRMPVKRTTQQELRIMDFSFLGDFVAVAYSDSSFRIWQLPGLEQCKTGNGHWRLLVEGRYRECCLLNIELVRWHERLWLLISSTDGHLVGYRISQSPSGDTWSLADETGPRFRFKIHQSSVRCAVCVPSNNGKLAYYSGGDDNALRGIELWVDDNEEVALNELFYIPDSHASAVTGIVAKDNNLFTVGSDQKLKIWTMEGKLVTSQFTGVADTGALVVQDRRIITGGIGIEFFEYDV